MTTIRMTDYVIIVIIYLKKESVMIMSKTTLSVLVNEILNSLGYKMLKIEFIHINKDTNIINGVLIVFS